MTVEHNGQQINISGITQVIFACGFRPDGQLHEEMKDAFAHVYCIGDAYSPHQALEVVKEAYEAAIDYNSKIS